MIKIIPEIVAVGIVGIVIVILLRQRQTEASRPVADHPPEAIGSPAAGPAPIGQPSSNPPARTESLSGDRPSPTAIPLVDRTNPAYATMVRQLDGVYLSMLRYYGRGAPTKDAELESAVQLLTTVRLSQMIHEATLATVTRSTAKSVTIAIPAYEAEGQSLQRYLFEKLPASIANPELNWELTKLFDHFGRYKQQIEASPDGQLNGETIYQIGHTTDNGLWTGSTLTSSLLGGYGVFEPLFPKP